MIKKILLLLCFAALLQSCDDRLNYDGNTRILFEGRIVNENGAPLQDIPLNISILKGYNDPYRGLYNEDFISFTSTDGNGYYKMIIPKPKYRYTISLRINQPSETGVANQEYSNTIITDIYMDDVTNNTMNINEQGLFMLQDAVTLSVTVNNMPTNMSRNLLTSVSGLVNHKIISLNNTYYEPPLLSTEYFNEFTSVRYTYTVAKNQIISFKYRLDGPEGPEVEHTIPIDNEPVNYTLDY